MGHIEAKMKGKVKANLNLQLKYRENTNRTWGTLKHLNIPGFLAVLYYFDTNQWDPGGRPINFKLLALWTTLTSEGRGSKISEKNMSAI